VGGERGVQIDKTVESIKEMRREVVEYVTAKVPAKPDELTKLQSTENPRASRLLRDRQCRAGDAQRDRALRPPDDYPQQRVTRIGALTLDSLKKAAATIQPAALTWVIVGDLKKIEMPIRELGLGDLKVVDADGRPLR